MALSNQKGAQFEIWLCRRLTQWVTGQPKPEVFWRSAVSGAKATIDAAAGREAVMGGDIIAIAPAARFFCDRYSVEAKKRAVYGDFLGVMSGSLKTGLWAWWLQCCRDAARDGKQPFLVFKENRSPVYLMTACARQRVHQAGTPNHLRWSGGTIKGHRVPGAALWLLEDWLAANPADKVARGFVK